MVDDDDGGFPSPEPRTDSRSALPREIRAWRRLRIVKHDESFSLIFFLPEHEYMELELRSVELHGAHEAGGSPTPSAHPLPRGPPDTPPTSTPTLYIHARGEKIREKDSSRFTIQSCRQDLISLRRADLESVRGSGEGNPSPSSSSTFLHHQFHDVTAVRE